MNTILIRIKVMLTAVIISATTYYSFLHSTAQINSSGLSGRVSCTAWPRVIRLRKQPDHKGFSSFFSGYVINRTGSYSEDKENLLQDKQTFEIKSRTNFFSGLQFSSDYGWTSPPWVS